MSFEFVLHFFKYPHAFLMPIVNLCEQWEVICGILIKNIVFNDHHLQLFHIEPSVHLYSAFVYQIYDLALFLQLL